MPATAVVLVVSPHVRIEHPVHPAAQVAIGVRTKHEMKMVRHKAIRQHRHWNLDAGMADGLEEGKIIAILEKDFTTIVAAIDRVITNAADRGSRGTGHDRRD